MAKTGNKTSPTGQSVDAFLAGIGDEGRRADALALRALLERISGETARMWGASIVGSGGYRYRYDSGREGTMARLGFSPRARELVLYVLGLQQFEDVLARLGKIRTGKGCLYLKRLADVEPAVLEELLRRSLAYTRAQYPENA